MRGCLITCRHCPTLQVESLAAGAGLQQYRAMALLGFYSREMCKGIFTVALSIIVPNWRQPQHLSTGKCVNKLWHIHTMDYYSKMKPTIDLYYNVDECQNNYFE